jgi:Ferredoxin subunits of nitrite reductase and ring-hydroxylating dioxygenases
MNADSERRDVVVAHVDDLVARERIVVDVDGVELGLYAYRGEVRAWHNFCPHQGGPVCQGKIMPRTIQRVREGQKSGGPGFSDTDRNIVCPWHGYEFDILTGTHPSCASVRLSPVPVKVVDGDVIVTI